MRSMRQRMRSTPSAMSVRVLEPESVIMLPGCRNPTAAPGSAAARTVVQPSESTALFSGPKPAGSARWRKSPGRALIRRRMLSDGVSGSCAIETGTGVPRASTSGVTAGALRQSVGETASSFMRAGSAVTRIAATMSEGFVRSEGLSTSS